MDPLIDQLNARLGPAHVLTAPEDLLPYAFDGTAALRQVPRVVVFPADTAEVAAVLGLARAAGVPVVARGSGTGLSGGSVPVPGALVLCLLRMNRILELDTRNLVLRAQHCCGSLHAHNGDPATARLLARRQLDAIISNAGGCGSHLRHYDHLLADDPAYAARAAEWTRKVRDVSEWLVEIGLRKQGDSTTEVAHPVVLLARAYAAEEADPKNPY